MTLQYLRPLLRCACTTTRLAIPRVQPGGVLRKHPSTQPLANSHQASVSCQQRSLFTNLAAMTTTSKTQAPKFSAGVGGQELERELEPLLASAGLGGRWALISTGEGLERSFKFKTFTKTWDFMTAVSLQCKLKNHHPEWSNVYNTTYIRWTTHNPKGLSAKDVQLAAICDGLAKDFGEIIDEVADSDVCALKQVADRAATNAGDCCTPKK
ncbi:transcriptional coactivator/pterin dehydratase [Hypoxylon sp. NC1633]|nr:transcriptional coactivator/pterin dehydratase [Hypoxylon sp. NC1633]